MNTDLSVHFPVSLFPEDKRFSVRKRKEFLKGLATFEGLYAIAEEALLRVKRLDLRSIDPLGADCACHVHAYYVANVGRKIFAESKFSKQLESDLKIIQNKREIARVLYESLRDVYNQDKLAKYEVIVDNWGDLPTIKEVLQKLDLITGLSAKVHCLIISYLLTITKDEKQITAEDELICEHCHAPITETDRVFKEVTNPKKLVTWIKNSVKKEVNSSLLVKDVCLVARTHLIRESHHFIKKVTLNAGCLRQLYFLENGIKVVQGKPELPDYYTLTAVFQSALYKKIPVILLFKKYLHLGHIYTEKNAEVDAGMLLLPSEKSPHFEPKALDSQLKNHVVMVVIAKKNGDNPAAYLKTLMDDFDFLHLCKLDGAQHKQYTDSQLHQSPCEEIPSLKKDTFSREAKKLEDLKKEAMTKGFAVNSPNARFSISHIFANTLEQYRTPQFLQFFAESANYFAAQKMRPLTSPNLVEQFQAADKRKELHRSNDRALLDLTPTLSEPDLSERIDVFQMEIRRLSLSPLHSPLPINLLNVSFLNEAKSNVNAEGQKIPPRSKSTIPFQHAKTWTVTTTNEAADYDE